MVVTKKKGPERNYLNDEIKANNIVLIDEEGEKMGVFSRNDALKKGEEEEKDIIQIGYNPKESIATAKLMEYGKFLYRQKKQQKEKKQTQKSKGVKEIKFGYNIGEKDLEMKIDRAKKFLSDNYNVKFMVRLKGREKIYKEKVRERLNDIEEKLSDIGKSQGVREENGTFNMILFAKTK